MAEERRPALDNLLNRLNSLVCFRSCRSSVRLMASREALVICKSWTFRSRLALATSSFRGSLPVDDLGLVKPETMLSLSSGSAWSASSSAACSTDAMERPGLLKLRGDGKGEVAGGLEAITLATEGGSATVLPLRECPDVLLGRPSELMRFRFVLFWPSCGADVATLRRSAMEGPELVGKGGRACEGCLGGEGALEATKAGDWGTLPVLPIGGLELVETTDPELEVMRLGFRSGVPLAYMNLLARGSGFEAARGGEKGAEVTALGPGPDAGVEGRLSPLA